MVLSDPRRVYVRVNLCNSHKLITAISMVVFFMYLHKNLDLSGGVILYFHRILDR